MEDKIKKAIEDNHALQDILNAKYGNEWIKFVHDRVPELNNLVLAGKQSAFAATLFVMVQAAFVVGWTEAKKKRRKARN